MLLIISLIRVIGFLVLSGVSVARALGVGFLKEQNVGLSPKPSISVPTVIGKRGDQKERACLIIASDGLWDVTTLDAIKEVCKESLCGEDAAKKLAKGLISRAVKFTECVDNVTTVVATINLGSHTLE